MKISIYEGCTSRSINVDGTNIYDLSKEDREDLLVKLILESDITEEFNSFMYLDIVKSLLYKSEVVYQVEESSYCETCNDTSEYREFEI